MKWALLILFGLTSVFSYQVGKSVGTIDKAKQPQAYYIRMDANGNEVGSTPTAASDTRTIP